MNHIQCSKMIPLKKQVSEFIVQFSLSVIITHKNKTYKLWMQQR
ncbi:MAG: hypothetical protein RIS29_220 [Bacteroidota bacterium]|jgi:hypothetical protein